MTSPRGAAIVLVLLAVFAVPAPASARQGAGALTLAAGGNGSGFAGDGGPATAAKLDGPHGAAVGPDGTLYIADTGNHRVRAVAPDGTIRTVAGDGGEKGLTRAIPPGAEGTTISLGRPTAVAVSADGSLYVADSLVGRVYRLAADGTIALLGELGESGEAREIRGLAAGADGTVFVSDRDNGRVVALDGEGTATVVAGAGAASGSRTPVVSPVSVAAGDGGDLWIAGYYLFRVRGGAVAAVTEPESGRWEVGDGAAWPPSGEPLTDVAAVATRKGEVFAVDRQLRTVVQLGGDGRISTLMPLPEADFGSANPVELTAGSSGGGSLYLIDTTGSQIFAAGVPAGEAVEPGGGTPTWIWIAGGAALAVLLVVGILIIRRRAATS